MAACFLLMTAADRVPADDWPQWMGPQRDNVWREDGVVEKFPEGGPPVAWRAPVGGGYAGPAVAGGKVYVHDYDVADAVRQANFQRGEFSGNERVLCLDEATGDELWRHEYPVKYTISYPAGPRCTPTVDEGRVYTLGSEGHLYCLDAASGEERWSKNFNEEFGAKTALWGYSGHPLVDGNKLICIVGGEGSFVVAFDKETGAELWRNLTSPEQGYAPPAILEIAGQRRLVLLRPDAVSVLDPESGREIWSAPFESDSGLVVMTPVVSQNFMFVGGYSNRSMLLEMAADGSGAEPVWKGDTQRGLSPVNVQPYAKGGVLYGVGHQDGQLAAMDIESGNRLWQTTAPLGPRPVRSGTVMIIRQGEESGRVWLFTENGDLVIAQLSPEGYEEIDRAHILAPTGDAFGRDVVWCSPAFANGRMVVRNDKECVAVELSAE